MTRAGQSVHQECRRVYIRPQNIAKDIKSKTNPSSTQPIRRRSEEPAFVFKEHCLFCGQPARYEKKKKGFDVIPVRTKDFQDSVVKICKERQDPWSLIVEGRIAFAQDLHAADAVYHQTCSVNFRTNKDIPQPYSDEKAPKKAKHGRPSDEEKLTAFYKVANFLSENDEEQTTVGDLVSKMEAYLEGTGLEAYTPKYMKIKLQEHFGENVIITELDGRPNVVTFRRTAESVLHQYFSQPKSTDCETEKKKLVEAAAQLIKNDIKSVHLSNEHYPSTEELSSLQDALDFIPESLKTLLSGLLTGKDIDLKLASLGQAMMKATRPKVLTSPLLLGLGIQLHHHFASRFLVDTLCAHGFCCSYTDVQRFEKAAAATQGPDLPGFCEGSFVQHVADNVDHNIRTLDGHGTFHGMGIIAAITPKTVATRKIPRVNVSLEDVSAVGRLDIKFYSSGSGTGSLSFRQLMVSDIEDPTSAIDQLWKVSFLLCKKRPSWSGMMQMLHQGEHPGPASVAFLPMIDMNRGDLTCVYSTLHFVCKQAAQYKVSPVLTFDQPLWYKALTIVENEPRGSRLKSIVLRLGGLHTEFSFLGAIGQIMAGSGLQEVLEDVYASNAVGHILSEKAFSRALRGHFLIDAALNTMLAASAYNLPLPLNRQDEDGDTDDRLTADVEEEAENEAVPNPELDRARDLLDELLSGASSADDLYAVDDLKIIDAILSRIISVHDNEKIHKYDKINQIAYANNYCNVICLYF